MSYTKQFRSLFAYHSHVNRLMLERAANISAAEFDAPGINDRSIRLLLFHILRTDYAWRVGLETGFQPPALKPEDYPSLSLLTEAFAAEEAAFNAYLQRVTDDEIQADLHLTAFSGYEADIPRWKILQHTVLHGEQHQAELAYLLTNYGQSPGDIDYIFYDDPPALA